MTFELVANAVIGWFMPKVIEKIKGSLGARGTALVTGILGTIIAFLIDMVFVALGIGGHENLQTIVAIGFGLNQTMAHIGYHTYVKRS